MNAASIKRLIPLSFALLVVPLFCSCGPGTGAAVHTASEGDEDGGQDISPQEQKYLAAAKPFLEAIAARNYTNAFDQLAKEAKSWMCLNQFVAPLDDKEFERNRAKALTNVSADQFSAWMKRVEDTFGQPARVTNAYVYSTDPKVLSGKGDKLDVLFAIGGIPSTVPSEARMASVRCQFDTKLTAAKAKQIAQEMGMTLDQLKQTEFRPYFNLKLVLVQDQSALKVGYFEFMPPSMLD